MSAGENSAHYKIDPGQLGASISPLLFGHNLEHTRSCMWRGLSAQLIRNRKFAGKPQQLIGAAMEWYAVGLPQTFFHLDGDLVYTRHQSADPQPRAGHKQRRNEMHSQLIQGCVEGERCGIGQDQVALEQGRDYLLRLAILGTEGLPVAVTVADDGGNSNYFSVEIEATGEWQVHEFEFAAGAVDAAARLEVTFAGAAELRIGFVSLLATDSFCGMRRDVIELLKEIGAPILRWPGGNFAGDYRWLDGLLDVDMRAPLNTFQEVETLPHTFGFDFHEMGIDEFIALCREVGAEPFISINLAWDSPEQCAAWVEYCNGGGDTEWGKRRVERGYGESHAVKYWSLGNELGYGHMEGPNDPYLYAEKAAACARVMRQVDPSIVLVMSGEWREEEWYSEGIPPLAPYIDHIALHQYDTALTTYLGEQAAAEFAELASAPSRTQERLKRVRTKVDEANPQDKFIGISFDEWNVWYAWYRTPGVAEGIYAAGMLNAFCRVAAEAGMSIGCYFEPINEGAIVIEPFAARLTPVGQVHALNKAHYGNRLVEVEGGEGADVIASVDVEAGSLVITLVNSSPTDEIEVQLSFSTPALSLLEGTLLYSGDFVPASVFASQPLAVVEGDDGVRLQLPKHSVAQLIFKM